MFFGWFWCWVGPLGFGFSFGWPIYYKSLMWFYFFQWWQGLWGVPSLVLVCLVYPEFGLGLVCGVLVSFNFWFWGVGW